MLFHISSSFMNFSGDSLCRRRRKPISAAYSGRHRQRSHWGHLLLRNSDSAEGFYASTGSFGGGSARNRCFPTKRAGDVPVRKLAAELRKLPFESEGSYAGKINYGDQTQMESATKWDFRLPETHNNFNRHTDNLLQDKVQNANANAIASLQTEVWEAQQRINKLETESQNKIKRLTREHDVRRLVDYLQHKLVRERKERLRTEAVNSRLLKKLTDSESLLKRLARQRDAAEEVCGELIRKVGAMKKKTERIREETAKERRMLQMAEVWREERARMKLADAKLALQEKYEEMNLLICEFESFLRLKRSEGVIGERSMRKAEGLRRMAESVNFSDGREFDYVEYVKRDDD